MQQSEINYTEQIIGQAIAAWAGQNKQVTGFFSKYEDSVYFNEVAPGRSRAIYILGHLAAVSDGLLPLFGLGERLFPELEPIFIRTPDRTVADIPTLAELKQKWETINTTLTAHFAAMSSADWMDRHMSVSPEDFAKEPTRNKFNVLLSRTIHQGYHMGQLNLMGV